LENDRTLDVDGIKLYSKPAVPNLFIDRAKFLNKKALRAKKGW
jgi:hypothetical protein